MESKPHISYYGDQSLFASLQFGISQQLSVEHVEWRRSFGRAAKAVYVEGNFVKFSEEILAKENDWKLIGQTFFHTYWTDCIDVDQYKATVKEDINTWLTILRNHGVHDWLIVSVETMDSRKGKAKLLSRASVLDKIKNDFCSRQPDRCVALLDPLKSDARGAESWQNLLSRIRQLILQAYNRNLSRFEEHMRSQRERRQEPGWSFCEYFVLQEELAFVFEMLGIYDEALVQYDELDALFTQFVLNSNVGDTPEWLNKFSRTCDSWMGLTLSKPSNQRKRDLIGSGKASLLDLRNYLFSRQCSILLLLYRPWEVAQRTLPFLHNCINELQILEVCLPTGAVSCWVFLSCLEVLQTCERFNDSSHVEAYSLYTAGLWAYARDKLQELGLLCGLMPGMTETSTQLHTVVGLLTGMEEESEEESKANSSPMFKLREALSSKDAFQKHYLELSELAMGTFKHIGRIRSARLIGKDLATFYMKLGEPQKAAAFLSDVLKTSVQENWTLITAKSQLELINCYKMMEDYEKCIKMCAQIAANENVPKDIRIKHFDEMVSLADRRNKGDQPLSVWAGDAFYVEAVEVTSDSDVIIQDTNVMITAEIIGKMVRDVCCRTVSVAVRILPPEDDAQTGNPADTAKVPPVTPLKSSHWMSSKTSINSFVPVYLDEQLDFKQDRNLTSAGLVCTNLQTILKRRDSQSGGFHKEREVIRHDFANCLITTDVVLKPGKNIIIFKYKAGNPGKYTLSQISIQTNNLEFLIPKFSSPISYQVVCQRPKLFLQRANKGDLIAGAEQELLLTVHTGSNVIEPDTVIRLQASKDLLLKLDNGEEHFLQTVECPLPLVGPFQTTVVKVKVLAEISSNRETGSLERKVLIVSPWSMGKQEALLVFVLPFTTSHKLHTTNNRKFIQLIVQGLQQETFEIFGHSLEITNLKEVVALPLNRPNERLLICKDQSASYIWEMVSNLNDCPLLRLEFSIYYRQDLAGSKQGGRQHHLYKHYFELSDYKTMYTIRSKVEPVGSEFCRVGSICHMNITIDCAQPNNSASLMYEVLADQMMWAVCGRTAGVITMGTDGQHCVTLDVMPLSRGFLPLPSVRLSKYIPALEQKGISVKDSPKKIDLLPSSSGANFPRLEPFRQGQLFNWTKAIQIHVLPALGTLITDSSSSTG